MANSIESACKGKSKYSAAGATKRLKKLRLQGLRDLRSYKCPYCNYWHVGHKPIERESNNWKRKLS